MSQMHCCFVPFSYTYVGVMIDTQTQKLLSVMGTRHYLKITVNLQTSLPVIHDNYYCVTDYT